MAGVKFDKPQQEAIDSRKGNFLVSAGAGSGKTAVLTERIKAIVLSGDASIDELLVLTFTDKAAAEMKSRTRDKLLEAFAKGEIAKDLSSEVECADITTFDAFFLKLVKKYAFTLGVDPDVTIADESILLAKQNELIDEVLEKRYAKMEPAFAELVKKYTLKDDKNIVGYIKGILHLCELAPNVDDLYEELKEKVFEEKYLDEAGQVYYEKLNEDLRTSMNLLEGSHDLLAKDHEYVSSWVGLGSYSALYNRYLLEKVA